MSITSGRARFAAIIAGLVALTGAASAQAADMPFAAPMAAPVAEDQPVLLGTGWYLRGNIAASQDAVLPIDGLNTPQKRGFPNMWAMGLGFGYRFNDYIRTDATIDFRQPVTALGLTSNSPVCGGAAGCQTYASNRLSSTNLLFNVYGDLGNFAGLMPYIGVGIGMTNFDQRISVTPGGSAWQYATNQRSNKVTYAGMMGVSYAITPRLTADLGYRYLYMGPVNVLTSWGPLASKKMDAHEARLSFRYTPDF
jgi:opacity protein-like surface antigen